MDLSDAQSLQDVLSVTGRVWRVRPHEPRDALAMAQRLGLPELLCRVLCARGVASHEAESYLKPTLREFLPDPFHLKDMEKAARHIVQEITASASPRIAVFGDYDVDGATSSALLVRYFRALGFTPLVHIPDRIKEGYGPNTPALLSLKERGAKIVITVDCGTMAFEPLASAKDAGLDVIVIDHHKGDLVMPDAYALVNPNRADETSPHTQLAAVGVVFLLLVALNKVLREQGREPPDLMQFLDIVALGTICDVVPLTGANRALVTQGLKILARRGNPGIAAAMDVARLAEAPGVYHAGFIIGPRINAGGRVGKSDLGVRLLIAEDPFEARAIAKELDRFNAERKAIETTVQEQAMEDASALPASDAVIVVAREGWHPGVIGIVAGRLKEYWGKPVAVIALANGIGKASARSITGIDLGGAVVAACHAGILLGGGGHAMAAGFSIAETSLADLREFFNARMRSRIQELTHERALHLDGNVSLPGITLQLVQMLEQAGPFGAGNASVRVMVSPVKVVHADIVGDGHVRAILVDAVPGASSQNLKAMAFRSAVTPLGETLLQGKGRKLHVAGQMRINVWQGRESVDFFIDDVAFA